MEYKMNSNDKKILLIALIFFAIVLIINGLMNLDIEQKGHCKINYTAEGVPMGCIKER